MTIATATGKVTAGMTTTAAERAAVAATRKTAAAAMATATAIATTAMMMATATVMVVDVQLLVRARAFKDVRLWGFDDLSPLVWFLRYAHCVLCPPLVRVLFQLRTDSARCRAEAVCPRPR